MMKFLIKRVRIKRALLAATLAVATVAHAQGIPVVDDGLEHSIREAQAQLPPNLVAMPSTYAQTGKAAATASANTDPQMLAELIQIDTTLKHLLELEQLRVSADSH